MDSVCSINNSDDPDPRHPATPSRSQEPQQPHVHRSTAVCNGLPAYDSLSIQTTGPANDADTYDTESTQTVHLAYDTDSNRTLNPAYDTDSTRALHPAYALEQMAPERAPGLAGEDSPTTSEAVNNPEEPPPYSPPDPKLAYLIYPPPLPHYTNQPVLACQPSASSPAFYQPSFLPTSTYPSYAIYMNGPPLGEEQPVLPKDYMVESLLVTIFCCLMSGLVALMYSYETRAALARGDIREGERASQKARLLVMFSLMFGLFVFVGWIIYVVIALCA